MNEQDQPRDYDKLIEMLHTHRSLNMLPLLELLVEQPPEYLEDFCNQVIFTVSELLREDQPGGVPPGRVMQIIQQLHMLRESLRLMRGAPSCP